MKTWFALWLVLGGGVAVARQDPKPTPPAPASADSKEPGLHLRKVVDALLGRWSFTETAISSSGASDGATHSGTEDWHTATGGMTLIEENQTRLAQGNAHDTALIWWDGKAQKILGVWCAEINSEGCSGFGVRWEGGDIVMAGEWEDEKGRHAWKEVFVFGGPDSFTQTLYVGPRDGRLERVSVIRATRARNAAARRLPG